MTTSAENAAMRAIRKARMAVGSAITGLPSATTPPASTSGGGTPPPASTAGGGSGGRDWGGAFRALSIASILGLIAVIVMSMAEISKNGATNVGAREKTRQVQAEAEASIAASAAMLAKAKLEASARMSATTIRVDDAFGVSPAVVVAPSVAPAAIGVTSNCKSEEGWLVPSEGCGILIPKGVLAQVRSDRGLFKVTEASGGEPGLLLLDCKTAQRAREESGEIFGWASVSPGWNLPPELKCLKVGPLENAPNGSFVRLTAQ